MKAASIHRELKSGSKGLSGTLWSDGATAVTPSCTTTTTIRTAGTLNTPSLNSCPGGARAEEDGARVVA